MVGKRWYTNKQIQDKELHERHKHEDPEHLKKLAHFIRLEGSTSTSENYRVALNFAKTDDPTKHMVLFVFCIHNYWDYFGFRLNTPQFSAHAEEGEILLMEGTPVAVMGVEEVLIDNAKTGDAFWN